MAGCSGSACGVIGKAVVIAAVCCAVSGVHWLMKPFDARRPDPSTSSSGATTGTAASTPTPPLGAAGTTGRMPLPPVAVPADGGKTFRSPDLPARDVLDHHMIGLADAKALFETGAAQWVDARSAEEYAQDRIGEALHISTDDWLGGKIPDVTHAMSRDQTVVVYCGGGNCDASKLVAVRLRGIGFSDVRVFEDGWKGWTAAKLPTAMHPSGAPGGGP